ncbi:hypothetical protein LOTGIDRAFT_222151 [Lottia gigantea]|uniref:Leukotriene A(4) hydrolase n=1 Tax=Lottia gigantea TaxID=225164 RepID=V3Z182_LOTGI|nr:hypothetical protein LOTGIDRAFT_222151 [Lottia gigantea]ESO84303.1 hypothetical protein LOTGIDRAFT_222151 [Lottia gigantea]
MAELSEQDPCSFSRPDLCIVTHANLIVEVDFERKVLTGKCVLSLKRVVNGCDTVLLDTRDLNIISINDVETDQSLTFSVSEKVDPFGSRLIVQLPRDTKSSESKISINYETSPASTALQWLSANQTAGKRHPYLFSQCEAIHARSLYPCQDTPSVKFPYSASVTCKKEITVLMSAIRTGSETSLTDPTKTVYHFNQAIPIPSYLLAIVAGDLESRRIGPRSHVWSERELVDKAAFEFSETEQQLQTGEDLLTPYVWGQYDLLVLPPTFPYGGMENPCLTFVTPTLLAGDKSLADVVAHEITHSWAGNLVTNKTFEDFWLNEGHTVFIERKITSRLHGGEPFRQFQLAAGWQELRNTVENVLHNGPYTRLIPDLKGVDPDDAFSNVPYEKGCALLYYLETLLGGPAVFEPFLKAYITMFAKQSIDHTQWKDFLYSFFHDKISILDQVDWQTWFFGQGMPPFTPRFDESLKNVCTTLCDRWNSATEYSTFSPTDLNDMLPAQKKEFLAELLEKDPQPIERLEAMNRVYDLNSVINSEIRFKWIMLGIKAHWEDVLTRAFTFINEQGRMKFVRPIYRALNDWEEARQRTIDNFQQNRGEMHNLTETQLCRDLGLAE